MKDIGDALLCASGINHDNEAVTLIRAASIVRKYLFSKKYEFDSCPVSRSAQIFKYAITKHRFSALAHYQIREQQNAIVKGDGGFVGLTENPDALRRWMVSAPETNAFLWKRVIIQTIQMIRNTMSRSKLNKKTFRLGYAS
ncbi:hypothetical protein DPMN_186526 [Dreissena polymorpha]|uniref:Uncharacterized protein n=1 Tax=Dreissena polymorpha TaxID=45954 RepID=A0A9D4DMC9_DREPO|nr:hypothetical protein DPMN_186526 [Dreissena polymorpha]